MTLFLGIDVQVNRGCAWALMDESLTLVESGWFPKGNSPQVARRELEALLAQRQGVDDLVVGIDAPRCPIKERRVWKASDECWQLVEPVIGRHCEVAVRAMRWANPQWTPTASNAPEWMNVGFALFEACADSARLAAVHEVFPSASYHLWEVHGSPSATIGFNRFARGPKDMIDAVAASLTVAEFTAGRGTAVGGGDGLGQIVVPCRVDVPAWLNDWPD